MANPRMQAAMTCVGQSCQPGTAALRTLQQVVPICLQARQELLPVCLKAGMEHAEAHDTVRLVVIRAAERLGHARLVVGTVYDRLELLRLKIQEGL